MKEKEKIYNDIADRFQNTSGINMRHSPTMTFFTDSVAGVLEDVYQEIYHIKTPYIFTDTSEEDLDGIGYLVNLPRETGEGDQSYRSRLMNWNLANQASNKTAINNALTNLDYCSDAKYKEMTHGAGTGSIFIIPKDYEEKEQAEQEVKDKIREVVSPGMYISYIFPEVRPVDIIACLRSERGDLGFIQQRIKKEFEEYVNAIAPGDPLEVGELNSIGYDQDQVDFFSILEIRVDGQAERELAITQDIHSKFILDTVSWVVE